MCNICKLRVDEMLDVHKEALRWNRVDKQGRMTHRWPVFSAEWNRRLREDIKKDPGNRQSYSVMFMLWMLCTQELDVEVGKTTWKDETPIKRHKDGLYDWLCTEHKNRSDDLLDVMSDIRRKEYDDDPIQAIVDSGIFK